ncbi:MAG: hypothetical protein AAB845_02275 [Patescibacteria group bacterium]
MRLIELLQEQLQGKSQKILSTSAFLMVAVLSFVGGTLFQKDRIVEEPKLVITVPDYETKKQTLIEEQTGTLPAPTESSLVPIAQEITPTTPPESQANCLYVGSKNSDKYHKASCGVVKRIKPENRRCFASPQVAEASGYKPGCVQ